MSSAWEDIARRKKQEQLSRIPKEWLLPASAKPAPGLTNILHIPSQCGVLSPQEIDITESQDATTLLSKLATGVLKSSTVTLAFCKRAALAHQLTNCLTETFFPAALARAEQLDAYHAQHGKPMGPLHGLPISLKDSFRVPGHDASIGIAAFCFQPVPEAEASSLVTLLLSLGAVLYCKTNVPQTLMALDSHNNVFGRVLNPWNPRCTAGGSSGGEGVLVAMCGSPLGVGTDVGGSIRIPAMCNGVVGVKPSWQRVPYGGQRAMGPPGSSHLALPASAGPIARSVRDCEMFLRVLADAEPWRWDADVTFGHWSAQGAVVPKSELVVGVVRRDGVIEPLPPIDRLMDECAAALRRQGITVRELDITPSFKQCQSIANVLFGLDGNNTVFDVLEATGEPLSPWLQTRLRRKKAVGLDKLREAHAKREEIRTQFLDVWRQVHVFICPVAPHPVPPIDRWNGVSYTSTFVFLDYPAGTLPVRRLQASDLESDLPPGPPLGPWDRVNRELWGPKEKEVYLDTPLSIQVVGPKMEERKLLSAMAIIDEALKAEIRSDGERARL